MGKVLTANTTLSGRTIRVAGDDKTLRYGHMLSISMYCSGKFVGAVAGWGSGRESVAPKLIRHDVGDRRVPSTCRGGDSLGQTRDVRPPFTHRPERLFGQSALALHKALKQAIEALCAEFRMKRHRDMHKDRTIEVPDQTHAGGIVPASFPLDMLPEALRARLDLGPVATRLNRDGKWPVCTARDVDPLAPPEPGGSGLMRFAASAAVLASALTGPGLQASDYIPGPDAVESLPRALLAPR